MANKFDDFSSKIRVMPQRKDSSDPLPIFSMWRDPDRSLESFYAPFDFLNEEAKIVIVGITPGKTQMNRALMAAKSALQNGTSIELALREIKREASFSGRMRQPLVRLLNKLGYAEKFGIRCCSRLWTDRNDFVHFCSLLKYPTFIRGADYNGQVDPLGRGLRDLVMSHFVEDLRRIPESAIVVPLGSKVASAIDALVAEGAIRQQVARAGGRVIGLPHPSTENTESIDLVCLDRFPPMNEYVDGKHRDYLLERPWEKKGRATPQSEDQYRSTRARRWLGAKQVREAYGLPV